MISRRLFNANIVGLASALGWPQAIGAQESSMTAIDSHAHVFKRGLPLAEKVRYVPAYDATPEDYIKVLDANGISNAVLIQPSFLGTDNHYMVDALERYPSRFRGIAVVKPDVDRGELRDLAKSGVVGIRLNLIGAQTPPLNDEPWPKFLRELADLDWQVEVQAEAKRWPELLDPLLKTGVKIVVDHFGKPDPKLGIDDPGFRYLLDKAGSRQIWIKISGSYRNGDNLPAAAIPLLKQRFGLERMVWGSDWPHTQFETSTDYPKVRAELNAWLPDEHERRMVLLDTPRQLFWRA